MKITRENFKNIVRETMIEENEYQQFFKKALEKTGKSIPDMSDEEKKSFFNKIDAAWKGKGEKNEELVGNQKKLDVDGDGEIDASDLAALRAGKKKDERFGRGAGVGPTFGSADQPEDEIEETAVMIHKRTPSGNIVSKLKEENESINEADVVGKTIFSDGKGKLFFGYYKTDDAVEFVDYKTWKKLSFKDVSKGDTNKERVIKAILKGQKQFNKKVDFNMWAKKNNPSFEQTMDWFIQNGWISNINKGGIKESVNEIQYKDAVEKFNDELIKHPMVKKAAQHYKKTPAEIVKVLQQRLSTKGNRGGDTKEVSIDFKDTDSGINVKHKKSFNESVNEASIDIKVGDMVKVDNPHWEGALGKKGPCRRKVKAIYDDNVFFTDGSNSSMKYIKK